MLVLSLPYVTSTTTGGCAYWLPAAGGGFMTTSRGGGRAGLRARYVTVTPDATVLRDVTPTVTLTANRVTVCSAPS